MYEAGLCLAWSETPEDMFCRVVAHIYEQFLNVPQAVISQVIIIINCARPQQKRTKLLELPQDKTNKTNCVPSEDSDQSSLSA